jgi:hypothetical protein
VRTADRYGFVRPIHCEVGMTTPSFGSAFTNIAYALSPSWKSDTAAVIAFSAAGPGSPFNMLEAADDIS